MSNSSFDPLKAPNGTHLWARLLLEELVRNGVTTFFVAPGSRSTPLVVAAARNPEARVVLHVDERGSAFATLGYGRAKAAPAGWITTSGTAVANGKPAVVESSVDRVPLILLTADRPPELRDTGANQTIDQVKIFGEYVRWHVDVPPPTDDIDPAYVLTTTDQAVHRATRAPAGPVHVNCSFRKPLEPVQSPELFDIPSSVEEWSTGDRPYTDYSKPGGQPTQSKVEALARAVEESPKGVIVAGRLDRWEDVEAVQRLAEGLGWPLLPDLTSHLRLGPDWSGARVTYGELILNADSFYATHVPDAVLQLGGRFSSKKLRQYLRDADPDVRAVVRPDPARYDPDHRVTHHVESAIEAFVDEFLAWVDSDDVDSEWRETWSRADEEVAPIVQKHARSGSLTEPATATVVSEEIPEDHALVAGSSMPVRDLNRHAAREGARVPAYANRGASGIDGTIATAAGVSEARQGPVTVLLGDVALWHDLNSLALLREQPVVVVVINNNGGGIFHFLPIQEYEDVFDPYFTTPQDRDFSSVADTFDLKYTQPDTVGAFRETYRHASQTSGPSLIEVCTDREENHRVHQMLESEVEAAVSGMDPGGSA